MIVEKVKNGVLLTAKNRFEEDIIDFKLNFYGMGFNKSGSQYSLTVGRESNYFRHKRNTKESIASAVRLIEGWFAA